ncbi:phage portal protein [Hymenobacter aerilatus]|uniref:Phage portal protein n=1 Tax=Hymenobacter aerilatus TaxID=2932251 RepID=A0A8T9SUT5_9BACT|nr:phage portal protein [Hymenobacter aerilatus]UOR05858.1 phage portal protein [Hymenobacter aerilatus]
MNQEFKTLLQEYDSKSAYKTKAIVGNDALGRTNPINIVGNSAINWLGTGNDTITKDGYSASATGYAIQNFILTSAKKIDWKAYKLTGDDNKKEPVTNHPLANILYRPNYSQSWSQFKNEALAHYLLTGNAYIWFNRNVKGKTIEMIVLPFATEVLGGGFMKEVTGYKVLKTDGTFDTYEAADVLHLKTFNPESYKYGLSPVTACYKAFTASNASLDALVKLLQNLGPAGVLFNKEKDFEWTPEQSNSIRSWYKQYSNGGKNQGQLPIFSNEVGYVKLGLNTVELEVLKVINASRDMICDAYSFPNQLLNGDNSSTFNNKNEARKSVYTNCVIPLETELRDGLNRMLGQEYNDEVFIDFDTSNITELQEDKKEMVSWLKDAWWVSTAEKQAMLGVKVDKTLPQYILPNTKKSTDETDAETDVADEKDKK